MDSDRQNVIYIPPNPAILEDYARRICQKLGEDFMQPHIVRGVTELIKVTAAIHTRMKNEESTEGKFDNEIE